MKRAKPLKQACGCCDEDAEKQLEFRIEGLGLVNVYSRLRIYAGYDLHFAITESETGGACIEIGGPYERS